MAGLIEAVLAGIGAWFLLVIVLLAVGHRRYRRTHPRKGPHADPGHIQ